MNDIARLGFEIDSTPLARAGQQADQAAQKIGKVGDAADQTSAKTSKATSAILDAMTRLERQLSGVADKLDRQADAQSSLSMAIIQSTRATSGQGSASVELERKLADLERQITDSANANKAAAVAAKQATAEARAQAEQAKASAAAEKRLTEETRAAAAAAKQKADAQKKAEEAAKKATEAEKAQAAGQGTLATAARGVAGQLGATVPILGALASGYGLLAGGIAGGSVLLARSQDQWGQYQGQLTNTLGSVTAARQAINDLYATAQGSGISFDATVSSFNRMARNANELGASNAEILKLSDTIQKLGIVSGAGQGELSSGMMQLSQALAAGRLNGDELRSIMENLPALAKSIADGLGVSVGQLRSMGEQGQLTSDKVFRAILSQSEKIQDQFKTLPDTSERAFTRVSDAWSKMLANMGEATNASGFLQTILNGTAGLLNLINGSGRTGTKEQGQMAGLESLRANLLKLPGADREGSDTWRRLQSVESQIKALQPKVQAQRDEAAAASASEAYRPAIARFGQGATAAKQAQTMEGSRSELAEQIFAIESALIAAGRRGTPSVLPADQQPTTLQVESMESALTSLRAKLADTTTALGKFTEGTADYREALSLGGTGGGLDIVRQAQALAQQMRGQGVGASTGSAIGAVVNDRVVRSGEAIKDLDRQTEAQKRLSATVGATRDATREAEIAQAAYDYRIKTFGTITTPEVEKAVSAYTNALRRNKQAQEQLADSRAFQAIADQIEVMQAGAAAIGSGSYAIRAAEAAARAAQADRQTPGLGARQMDAFSLGESRNVNQMLDDMRRQTAAARTMAGATSFGDLSRRTLEQQIADAQRNAPLGRAGEIDAATRAQHEADVSRQLNDQTLSLQEQVQLQDEQFKLIGVYGQELAVQEALLQKRVELKRMGVALDSEEAQRQLELTERVARKGAMLDQARSDADSYAKIWTDAGASVTGALSASFVALFDKNARAADVLRQKLSDSFSKMADNLMNTALKPVETFLTGLLKQAGSYIAGMFGGGGGGGGGALPIGGIGGTPQAGFAMGGAFGVQAFANGGAFTNSIVSSPTLFRFASGGLMKRGLMGEAGPEAIMPLRRGSDWRLGVAASGGGGGGGDAFHISISVDSSGGQQTQGSGDAADNRGQRLGEAISVAVKQEIVNQQRPGGLLARR